MFAKNHSNEENKSNTVDICTVMLSAINFLKKKNELLRRVYCTQVIYLNFWWHCSVSRNIGMANHPPHFRADWLLPGQLWRRHVELHHPRLPHPLHHHPLPAARRRAQPGTRRPPGLRHRAAADPTAGKGGGGGAAGRRQNRHPIPGPDVASWRRLSAAAALPAPALGRCVQQGIHNLPIFYLGPGGGFALHSENFTFF